MMVYSMFSLKRQSTLRLLGLSIITFGIYSAYYVRTQTKVLNKLNHSYSKISKAYVNTLIGLSYASAITSFLTEFMPENQLISTFSSALGLFFSLIILAWSLGARNRVNSAFDFGPNHSSRFNLIWSILFNLLYFNYKVNVVCDEQNVLQHLDER